ncbi:hypothetical protein B0J17DRAFT_357868 [Rhizoctonia solani]|nr:hypothetical protein B0J17DRAFT_357868 [Rhizoctonia solani]
MNPRPTEEQITALVERAGTLFISAATIARCISYDNFQANPHDRLENVLNASSGTKKHKDIDELYTDVLQGALDNPDLEDIEIEDRKQVLYTVICAKEPLTVDTLSKLLKMKRVDRVHAALRPLWSVLHVSSTSDLVTTFHASFPDYMLDPLRSKQYHCDPQMHNRTLALACFDCFRNMRPQFNICGLESSFIPHREVPGLQQRVKEVIKTETIYAARYWGVHLRSARPSPDLLLAVEEVLSVRLLLWMEVMNLKYKGHFMLEAIQPVEEGATEYLENLQALVYDALAFVRISGFRGTVPQHTSHLYVRASLLAPVESNCQVLC